MLIAKNKPEVEWGAIALHRLFAILLFSLAIAPCYSLMLKMDNVEIVTRSDLVIYGVVQEIHSHPDHQEAVVSVEQVLKGELPGKPEIRVIFSPGLEDSPVFEKNERVLLFLRKSGVNQYQTVGGFQGKFSLN